MRGSILVTGATGALGPQLAAELLARRTALRINVLLRGDRASLDERFGRWTRTVCSNGPDGLDVSPLCPVAGNVCEDGLDLDAADRSTLMRQTEVIIHAAADTRFHSPPDEQWNTNVEGTRRVLEFARACPRLRQFIFISTCCVAGSRTGRILETFAHPPGFTNHYERTKWEAERLALSSGLPVQVARVSVVLGSHASGFVHRLGALHQVLRWFGRGFIPLVPGTPQTTVDLIPTETVAQFLARAITEDAPAGAIWHIAAGNRAIPLAELVECVWNQPNPMRRGVRHRLPEGPEGCCAQTVSDPFSHPAEPPRIVDAATFEEAQRAIDPCGDPFRGRVAASIGSFLPGLLLYPKTLDTTQAETCWGGPLPLPDWRITIERVLRFIGRHDEPRTGRTGRLKHLAGPQTRRVARMALGDTRR